MSGHLLETHNLTVRRESRNILSVTALAVNDGEILSLIGPNGAGKTTLLLALASLIPCDTGSLRFRGQQVETREQQFEYRRKISMVFQEPLLLNTTVFNNVATGLRLRDTEEREVQRKVSEVLELFGIGHLKDRRATAISGGEAQRTSLARAFVLRPDILFLDEPFSALDPLARETLLTDMEYIFKKMRTTVVFATHDRMEAIRLAGRLAVIHEGSIIQIGPTQEVLNAPENEFIASFVGVDSILFGTVRECRNDSMMVDVGNKMIEAVGAFRQGDDVLLCIRPENVVVSRFPVATSSRNVFSGIVKKITPMEHFFKVSIDCGFALSAHITKNSLEEMGLKELGAVTASFKATSIHVIKRVR